MLDALCLPQAPTSTQSHLPPLSESLEAAAPVLKLFPSPGVAFPPLIQLFQGPAKGLSLLRIFTLIQSQILSLSLQRCAGSRGWMGAGRACVQALLLLSVSVLTWGKMTFMPRTSVPPHHLVHKAHELLQCINRFIHPQPCLVASLGLLANIRCYKKIGERMEEEAKREKERS